MAIKTVYRAIHFVPSTYNRPDGNLHALQWVLELKVTTRSTNGGYWADGSAILAEKPEHDWNSGKGILFTSKLRNCSLMDGAKESTKDVSEFLKGKTGGRSRSEQKTSGTHSSRAVAAVSYYPIVAKFQRFQLGFSTTTRWTSCKQSSAFQC